MIFAKVVTVLLASVLTVIAARRLMREVEAAKVRVKPRQPSTVTKLRQDPSTGVYYPVE
ncbi:MAG: hypothetical protein ABL936_02120 [Aestuariivirga sp.]